MTATERWMLTLGLLFGLLTLALLGGGRLGQALARPAVSGSFYGANDAWVAAAAAEWPQRDSNWCGVATVELVANYTYQMAAGQSYSPFQGGGQQRIANDMNSAAAISQWGTPSGNGIGPGFKADIARDFGTDPRSIAWAILYESTAGTGLHLHHPGYLPPKWATSAFTFHNVIYHGDVTHAMAGMARTLERFQQPLSVTTAHGLHSDVVSGVYATNDPIAAYPANVDAVDAWDPGVGSPNGGYQSAREVIWDNYTFNTNRSMWGSTYSANGSDDPDPAVGIYVPAGSYPAHWIGYRTDIEPDTQVGVSVDYALDENGNVMQHP
jgi:hypothetical protein